MTLQTVNTIEMNHLQDFLNHAYQKINTKEKIKKISHYKISVYSYLIKMINYSIKMLWLHLLKIYKSFMNISTAMNTTKIWLNNSTKTVIGYDKLT